MIGVRILWVFPFTYWPPRRSIRLESGIPIRVAGRRRHPWTGMRGVVSLAAAFALPHDFPSRELILFLTFAVVLGTLVFQGFSLPWVIRKLTLATNEEYQDKLVLVVLVGGERELSDHPRQREALQDERAEHDREGEEQDQVADGKSAASANAAASETTPRIPAQETTAAPCHGGRVAFPDPPREPVAARR